MAITLTQAQAALAVWLDADIKVASGQAYSIDGRQLTRADANAITNKIDYWRRMVTELTPASAGGRRRIRYPIPE